jgi:hypothetical protein
MLADMTGYVMTNPTNISIDPRAKTAAHAEITDPSIKDTPYSRAEAVFGSQLSENIMICGIDVNTSMHFTMNLTILLIISPPLSHTCNLVL